MKMPAFLVPTLACIFFWTSNLSAKVYHVDPVSGDDVNDGTLSKPLRTISALMTERAPDGQTKNRIFRGDDKILLRTGQKHKIGMTPWIFDPTNTIELSADSPLLISSYVEGDRDPIRPALPETGETKAGMAEVDSGNLSGITINNLSHVRIENISFIGHSHKNLGYKEGLSGVRIVSGGGEPRECAGILMQGVKVSGYSDAGIEVRAGDGNAHIPIEGMQILHSDIGYNGAHGIFTTGHSPEDLYPVKRIYIADNNVHHTFGYRLGEGPDGNGIAITSAEAPHIHGNRVYSNGGLQNPSGIYTFITIEAIISSNHVWDTRRIHMEPGGGDGNGIDFNPGTQRSKMVGNYIFNNEGPGAYVCCGPAPSTNHELQIKDNVIAYNFLYNNGVDKTANWSDAEIAMTEWGEYDDSNALPIENIRIHNNVVVRDEPDKEPIPGTAAFGLVQGKYPMKNIQIFDNLFIAKGAYFFRIGDQNLLPGLVIQNNHYVHLDENYNSDQSYKIAWNLNIVEEGEGFYSGLGDLNQWRKITGHEKLRFRIGDPKIVGELGRNDPEAYKLQNNSPLIDQAMGPNFSNDESLRDAAEDFFGNPLRDDEPHDIGFHEVTKSMGVKSLSLPVKKVPTKNTASSP